MIPQRIVITGAQGYIGSQLSAFLKTQGYSVKAWSHATPGQLESGIDFTNPEAINQALRQDEPAVIIHTAGLSSLAAAEQDHALADQANTNITNNLVSALTAYNPRVRLIFLSSDYVFDGINGQYTESDQPQPATYYGVSKLRAEKTITDQVTNYVICRTAAVFGQGGNFFNWLVQAAERRETIELFSDTFFSPTYIGYLLTAIAALLKNDYRGILHLAGPTSVSRFEFGKLVLAALGGDVELVHPIKQPRGGLVAPNSSLNTEQARQLLPIYTPSLEKAVQYAAGNLVYPHTWFLDQRGSLRGLINTGSWAEANYIESIAGSVRGRHYHRITTECFSILAGKIQVTLADQTSGREKKFIVEKNDTFVVLPNIVHTFEVLEDARWINLLSDRVDENHRDFYKADAG